MNSATARELIESLEMKSEHKELLLCFLLVTDAPADDYLYQTHRVFLQIIESFDVYGTPGTSEEKFEKLAEILFSRFIRPMWATGSENDSEIETASSTSASRSSSIQDLFLDDDDDTIPEIDPELIRQRVDAFFSEYL
jgi:hypothetical protein